MMSMGPPLNNCWDKNTSHFQGGFVDALFEMNTWDDKTNLIVEMIL